VVNSTCLTVAPGVEVAQKVTIDHGTVSIRMVAYGDLGVSVYGIFDPNGRCDTVSRRVVMVGQGHVGLPVAIRSVEVVFDVIGSDIDKARIDRLRKVETFIDDITDSDLVIAVSTDGICSPTILDPLHSCWGPT
jgi:UDP-glucose/GDP-mannose dehydrogenase family protein